MKNSIYLSLLAILIFGSLKAQQTPNVILICTDDLGFGDLSSYGAKQIQTPNLDKMAAEGIRFTNAHSTSATCTPSRFAMLTGVYPWRRSGTNILPGDAALIIPIQQATLPKQFKQAGYRTGLVGKWHLGLGTQVDKDWNAEIKPGPREVGFDYSFIFPATADRVPTVFLDNQRVIGLDKNDTIRVSYGKKIGNEPTGKDNPELLKMKSSPNHGHNQTIVNGIGRIGYMTGGKMARWTDEEMPLTFMHKAMDFIEQNKNKPFFLLYNLTEPHVPRMPSTMFKGKSKLGARGDVILQLDWTIGQLLKQLKSLGIDKNTMIIFTSDNGPVLDDGYQDEAVEKQNGHLPAGPFRGGKYSAFEGGTRVPFIVRWPGTIKPAVSNSLLCQVDILASMAALTKKSKPTEAIDSENLLDLLVGKSTKGRSALVLQGGAFSVVSGDWKYIEPRKGPAIFTLTNTESGNAIHPQLYNLKTDSGERDNLAEKYPEKVKELNELLLKIRKH